MHERLDLVIDRSAEDRGDAWAQRRGRAIENLDECSVAPQTPEPATLSLRAADDSEPLDITPALQTWRKLGLNDLGFIELDRYIWMRLHRYMRPSISISPKNFTQARPVPSIAFSSARDRQRVGRRPYTRRHQSTKQEEVDQVATLQLSPGATWMIFDFSSIAFLQ